MTRPELYRLEPVTSSKGRDFLETYGLLAAEFGPRGELERRVVVEAWLDRAAAGGWLTREPLAHRYHLLAARHASGALVGARDAHVVADPARNLVLGYLAHVVVSPAHRSRGLGRLLRGAGASLVRRAALDLGLADADLLLAAEMEWPAKEDAMSTRRLALYARDGFAAINPSRLPYAQPDFREARGAPDYPHPIPLLAVVKWLRHEGAAAIPVRLARAFVTHLHAVFRTHVAASHLDELAAQALASLQGAGDEEPVPLVPLGSLSDYHHLA